MDREQEDHGARSRRPVRRARGDARAAGGAAALAQRASFEQSSQDLRSMLSDLTDVVQARASQASSDANAVADRVQGMQIWFTIAVFAGFFYAARLVSRGITKPLADCVVGLESLAQADLTSEVRVTGSDEVSQLGASFNRAVGDLSTVVRRIRESASTLASS